MFKKLVLVAMTSALFLFIVNCGDNSSSNGADDDTATAASKEEAAYSLQGLVYAVNTTDVNSIQVNSDNKQFYDFMKVVYKNFVAQPVEINSDSGTANCASSGTIDIELTEETSTYLAFSFDFNNCSVDIDCDGNKNIVINDSLLVDFTINDDYSVLMTLKGTLIFGGHIDNKSCLLNIALLCEDSTMTNCVTTGSACGYDEDTIDPLIEAYCSI